MKNVSNPLTKSSQSANPKDMIESSLYAALFVLPVLIGLGVARPIASTVLGVVSNLTGLDTGESDNEVVV